MDEFFVLLGMNEDVPPISMTLLTRSPGVGKTLFLIYCVFRLVNAGKSVFSRHAAPDTYRTPSGARRVRRGELPPRREVLLLGPYRRAQEGWMSINAPHSLATSEICQ